MIADCTLDMVVLTLTPRLTSLEMPVEASVAWLSVLDVPVSITVAWLSATEAPVDTTVAMLVPDETAVDTDVRRDATVEMPTFAVDNDDDARSQMLFSVETLAEVEVVVVFDWAVESRVASEVTDDSRVDSDWVPDKAALWPIEIELATDSRVEPLTAWLTLVD